MNKYILTLIIISFCFQGCINDSAKEKNDNSNQQKDLNEIRVSPSETDTQEIHDISQLLDWFDIPNEKITLVIRTSSSLHGKTYEYITISSNENEIKLTIKINSFSKEVISSKEKVISALNDLIKSVGCLNDGTFSSVSKNLLITQKNKNLEFNTRNPKWKGIEKFKEDIFDL